MSVSAVVGGPELTEPEPEPERDLSRSPSGDSWPPLAHRPLAWSRPPIGHLASPLASDWSDLVQSSQVLLSLVSLGDSVVGTPPRVPGSGVPQYQEVRVRTED